MRNVILFFVIFCSFFVFASASEVVDQEAIAPIAEPEIEIVVAPASVTVPVGKNSIFTCIALGDDLSYYWQYSNNGGSSWYRSSSAFPGYNTNQMIVAATVARNGFLYRCVISNSTGTLYSPAATLTVITDGSSVPNLSPSDVILLSVSSVAAAGSWFEAILSATGMRSLYITMLVVFLVVGSLLIPILGGRLSAGSDSVKSKPRYKNSRYDKGTSTTVDGSDISYSNYI